jgi:glucokinase
MNKILLLDLGGTNLRYALSKEGSAEAMDTKKIALDTILNFDDFIEDLVKKFNINSMIISAAGPKVNGVISMTNRDLVIDEQALKVKFNLHVCVLLNDWESIGYSLSNIQDVEIELIKKGNPFNSNTFFIGPGTGLGAALKVQDGKVIPTEIGNTTGLTKSLLNNYLIDESPSKFITLEDVVSGSAISSIYEYKTGNSITSEGVVKLLKEGDKDAESVINGFTKSLAEVISDMALTFISGNGIYIAGSLMRTIVEFMDKDLFIEHFIGSKKGIHLELLEKMPIGMINREHACLQGNLNFYNQNIK